MNKYLYAIRRFKIKPWIKYYLLKNVLPEYEVTSTTGVFYTDMVAPLKKLLVSFEPIQSGSGIPSPTNVRPISGRTECKVYVSSEADTESYTIPLGQTVYGGTLNVVSGVLTVDMAIVDMGTLNWLYYSAQKRIVAQVNDGKPAMANIGLDGACSVYKVVNTAYRLAPDKSIIIGNNFISNSYAAMVVHDEDYTDAETFKTAVSGQTLVYPIKTPVTYQLTPQQINTLKGNNTVTIEGADLIELIYLTHHLP